MDHSIESSEQVERASINRDVDKTSSENEVAHESVKLLPPVAPEDSEITSSCSENIKEPPDKSSKPPQRRLSTVSDIFDSSVSS